LDVEGIGEISYEDVTTAVDESSLVDEDSDEDIENCGRKHSDAFDLFET
jgi:hypothetical protein